jgi:ABC-type branched-subunit amino acid transport system permease subunit
MSTVAPTASADRADTVLFTPPPRRRLPTVLVNVVVVVVLAAAVLGATFNFEQFNQLEVAKIVAYIAAVAGLSVLVGLNGQLSLGHGALMAVAGYTVALMQKRLADSPSLFGWRIAISLAVGVGATIVVGLVVGIVAARLRGPYLAGVTLAVALVVPAIASLYVKTFKSDQGLPVSIDIRPTALHDTISAQQWKAWIAIFATVPVMILLANVVRSRFGRTFKAVRDDEVAAQLSGISVPRTQILAFVISAACAGLSGGLFAVVYGQATPGLFSLNLSLFLLAAVVLGGLGSLWGALWGSIILIVLPDTITTQSQKLTSNASTLDKLNGNLSLAVFGIALVLVMLVASGGIQGLIQRIGRLLLPVVRGRQTSR